MSKRSVFEVNRVSFGYTRSQRILDDVSLRIDERELIGVIGPNGAGKSTLIALLTGLLAPSAGTIHFEGKDVARWDRRSFAREVAVVPQREEGIFPYTVREVILMGRYAHRTAIVGFDDPEDEKIARNCAETCGVAEFLDRRLSQLSGGERQRVLLARALAQCPHVLLLDEPTSSLDLRYQKEMVTLLSKLNREHGNTVVVVLHDINLAARLASRLLVIGERRLYADGKPNEILTERLLRDLYKVPVSIDNGGDFPRVEIAW